MLPPAPAYGLYLTCVGTVPSDRRCLIPSHCRGRCGLIPPSWVRCRAPRKDDPFWCCPSESIVDWISCGEPCPYRASLSGVRIIMMFMHAPVMESLCQIAMRWISTLKFLLPCTRGSQWLRLALSGIKWPHHPRMPALRSLAVIPDFASKTRYSSHVCQRSFIPHT
jgi:hypothetical protein